MIVASEARNIGETHSPFFDRCLRRMYLTLSGLCDLHDLKNIPGIKEISGLGVSLSGASTFPDLKDMLPHLETLSLRGGRVVASERDPDPFLEDSTALPESALLPVRLTRLVLLGDVDHCVLHNFLSHGMNLQQLTMRMPCIADGLRIDRCCSLRVLELFAGKEFIGETLKKIESLPNLETLHFGGCLNLTADNLNSLTHLKKLKELFISNSVLGRQACDKIASIQSLRVLRFHSCLGVKLLPLDGIEGLKTLIVCNCVLYGGRILQLVQ